MKFRNPETGEVFEDISDALEDAYQCWDCPGIGSCPIGRKAMNYNMDCCSVVEKHAEKAARLMGYEVVEDATITNCHGLEEDKFLVFLKDFQRELGKRFTDIETRDKWIDISSTAAWKDALIVSSRRYMPEVFALWDKLEWWASDLLDGWLIDCAKDARLFYDSEEEPTKNFRQMNQPNVSRADS